VNSDSLHPPALAKAVTAKGFAGAAGFRVVEVKSGHAELALAHSCDLVQFFGHFRGGVITALADQAARACALCTATPRALDFPAETQ
jgi:acyl-coenzyme A thioesterase PaaI-like protein